MCWLITSTTSTVLTVLIPLLLRVKLAEIQQQAAREQFEQEILAQEQGQVPQAFQRPQQEMPQRGRQENAARNFWNDFGSLMDNRPEDAWKYLSSADPRAFQQKLMVQAD